MNTIKLLKLLVTYVVFIATLSGMNTIVYSVQHRKFCISHLLLGYSIIAIAIFIIIYLKEIANDFLTNQFDLRDAVKLYSYMNIFATIVSYISAIITANAMLCYMSKSKLFKVIEFLNLQHEFVKPSVVKFVLKIGVIPLVTEITLILRQLRNEPERSLFWTIYTVFPTIISSLLPNCFFGALVISKHLFGGLNKHLLEIVKEVNYMQTKLQMHLQKPYYRMQRFCDLSDKLDGLAEIYALIYAQTLEYLQLISVQFLCSLLCNLFGITAGLFTQYRNIADALITKEPYDVFDALTNAVFLIISLCEIALLASVCNDSLIAVQETANILQSTTLLHVDIRFKQSVEAFALLISVINYKIHPLGVLEINVSIIRDVLSAVASFLLILIQSDLTLRYSLT